MCAKTSKGPTGSEMKAPSSRRMPTFKTTLPAPVMVPAAGDGL